MFLNRYEHIKNEFHILINKKRTQIEKISIEVNDLNIALSQIKKEFEIKTKIKENETKKLIDENNSLKFEIQNLEKDFNNLKKKFEIINENDIKYQANTQKSMLKLEEENKRLTENCFQFKNDNFLNIQINEKLEYQLNQYNLFFEELNVRIDQLIFKNTNFKHELKKCESVNKNKYKSSIELEKRIDDLIYEVLINRNLKKKITSFKKKISKIMKKK